jgi:hypothetical protein
MTQVSPPIQYFPTIIYNPQFWTSSSSSNLYLGRIGTPTSIASTTTFTGAIVANDLSVVNVIQGTALKSNQALSTNNNANLTHYLTYTDQSTNGYGELQKHATLTFNPNQEILTAGNITATSAMNTTNLTCTNMINGTIQKAQKAYVNITNTNAEYLLTFTDDITSNYVILQKSTSGPNALTYNPSTNTLTAPILNASTQLQEGGATLNTLYAGLLGGNQFVDTQEFYNPTTTDIIRAMDNTHSGGFNYMNNVGSIGYYTGSVINWSIAYDGTATIPRPIFTSNVGITATATYNITANQSGQTFYVYGNTATAFTLPTPTNNLCFYHLLNGNSSNSITITCATNGGYFLPYAVGTQTISIPVNTTITIRCDSFNWLLIENGYRTAQLALTPQLATTNTFALKQTFSSGIYASQVSIFGQLLNFPSPPISTTSSLSLNGTDYYDIYPINATGTITITLPSPVYAISGMTFQFRRVNTSAVAINCSPSYYPIGGTTLTTALLTASTTTQAGMSIKLMCVLTSGTTYNYYQIA